jgi:NADH-quinone oxidoreductase subunit N
VLIFGGFAYKMAAFPMHFWCPDVYEGAPTPVTAWLSVASKAAGFAVFVRFLMAFSAGFDVSYRMEGGVLDQMNFGWQELVAAVAALSMTVGNLAALWQTNVKRMLAYSSVAHAGYLLMGVAAIDPSDPSGTQFAPLVFYFMAYFAMNLGAFYIVNLVAAREGREDIEGYRSLGRRSPIMAFCLTLFLFSLIGLPPTGGFVGKMQLFMAVIDGGLVWLAVVAGINTAISVYYYARLLKAMYLQEEDETVATEPLIPGRANLAFLGGFAVLVLVLGVAFSPLAELAQTFSF